MRTVSIAALAVVAGLAGDGWSGRGTNSAPEPPGATAASLASRQWPLVNQSGAERPRAEGVRTHRFLKRNRCRTDSMGLQGS